MEGSIAGWVWQNQEACCYSRSELEDRFPFAKTLLKTPVKSVCSLPLTTAHQRLGVVKLLDREGGRLRSTRSRIRQAGSVTDSSCGRGPVSST